MPPDLARLRELALAAKPQDDWAAHRTGMTTTPETRGKCAAIWHDDGDMAAEVHGNLGLNIDADALAEFWAAANPTTVLALLVRLERAETALIGLSTCNMPAWECNQTQTVEHQGHQSARVALEKKA